MSRARPPACRISQLWDRHEEFANSIRFMRLPGYHRDLDIVSVAPNGVIAAYVNGWIDPVNKIGDFGPVGALEPYRRLGLTRAALLEGLRRMKAYGMNRVCVSTGVSNVPARQLYESIGFKNVNRYLDFVRTPLANRQGSDEDRDRSQE